MKSIKIILLLLLTWGNAQAQESRMPADTTFRLNNSTFTEVFYFKVEPSHQLVTHQIKGQIDRGYLSIKITDAKGHKTGGFTLKSQQGARGTAEDVYSDPAKGRWKVKVVAKEATGKLRIGIKLDEEL